MGCASAVPALNPANNNVQPAIHDAFFMSSPFIASMRAIALNREYARTLSLAVHGTSLRLLCHLAAAARMYQEIITNARGRDNRRLARVGSTHCGCRAPGTRCNGVYRSSSCNVYRTCCVLNIETTRLRYISFRAVRFTRSSVEYCRWSTK